MTNYYNENDAYAAQWLRNLISAGHIAPGVVDERSIEDVRADELREFTQCHFFAGIGIWSYALRRGGWSDDRPVWTGSCPCQPFSGAGKGKGHEDKRHLWPTWERLIGQCKPDVVLGEQVSGPDGLAWFDLVSSDMEKRGYAIGAIVATAAGVGAPHGRHRIYFMANAGRSGRDHGHARDAGQEGAAKPNGHDSAGRGGAGALANTGGPSAARHGIDGRPSAPQAGVPPGLASGGVLDDAVGDGRRTRRDADAGHDRIVTPTAGHIDRLDYAPEQGLALWGNDQDAGRTLGKEGRAIGSAGPVNGFWRDAEWVLCRDPKGPRWRPIEPGSFPVVDGAVGRVGRLRAYGNGLNAETAIAFVSAVMEVA